MIILFIQKENPQAAMVFMWSYVHNDRGILRQVIGFINLILNMEECYAVHYKKST